MNYAREITEKVYNPIESNGLLEIGQIEGGLITGL